jgi:predicted RND superfamily exporter protein/GGDEF domain-containing protein
VFRQAVKSFSLSRWLSYVAKNPVRVLLIILILTVPISAKIPMLNFSMSLHDLIVDDTPERLRYDNFKALFGTDEVIHVVVKGDDLFSPPFFAQLRNLTETFDNIPGVSRVISLPQIKNAVDPQDKWSLERFANVTSQVSIFQRYIISPDHRVSGITLILDAQADHYAISRNVAASLSNLDKRYHAYQIGMPTVSIALSQYTQQDFLYLPVYTLLIVVALLLIMFRSVVEMAVPMFTVMIAGVWTLGAIAWSGLLLNMLTVVVPILLIAVGTAYCLYIYCTFKACVPYCSDARSALLTTFSRITYPTLIAVFTTIAGIGSLMATSIEAVRQFSGFACFGILALLVSVLTFLPCMLTITWPILRKRALPAKERFFSPARVDKLVNLIVGKRRRVLLFLTVVSLFLLAGIFRIRVETNPLSYFKLNTPINQQFHDIYQHLSGSFPLHLQISTDEEDYFLSTKAIKILSDHQRFLETLPGVDKTLSFADYLMLVNYVTNKFDAAHYKLPEAEYEIRMLANQFKSLLGRDILNRYVNGEFSAANITMLTRLHSSKTFIDTEKLIREYCYRHRHDKLVCRATGFAMVMSLGSRHLVVGQVWSLLITLGIILLLMHWMFFSIKLGVIAMVANLFPVLVSFGAMGWLGIELSMGTCLIASIVLGLAVDDTIHYLVRYKMAYAQEMDSIAAMRQTLIHLGQPIVATSVTISAGFSVLLLSSFTPTAVFGLLMMLVMASALIGGLVILPALLSKVSPITLEEIFQVRIGRKHLQDTVPLLKGMTRPQVHRILRTGKIHNLDRGFYLFEQGDVADSIYVVISGVFDALMSQSIGDTGRRGCIPKRVNRLVVGDVIGEMGVMSSGFRCVSVVAVTPGEVLALSQDHLARIRRLYPRTAIRFFANLSSVLTEKLIKADLSKSHSCSYDYDTGMLNREAFLDCCEKEINQARRFDHSLAICLLEVDDTERYFDDKPLEVERFICLVSRVVAGSVRIIDTMGRLDQLTMAVLLPRTTSSHGSEICKRLKTAFRSQKLINEKIKTVISCRFVDLECLSGNHHLVKTLDPAEAIRTNVGKQYKHVLYATPPFELQELQGN